DLVEDFSIGADERELMASADDRPELRFRRGTEVATIETEARFDRVATGGAVRRDREPLQVARHVRIDRQHGSRLRARDARPQRRAARWCDAGLGAAQEPLVARRLDAARE